MKYSRNICIISICLGGFLIANHAVPAHAGDDKVFAPQFCVPLLAETSELGNASVFVDAIERFVPGGHEQHFICPLMRDIIQGDLDRVWIRVGNEVSEELETAPDCCVDSFSPLGTDSDSECKQAAQVEGRQTLEFELDNFTEFPNGYYVVSCWMGVGDRIYSIRTSESD